jgi:hypothetical protein
MSIADEARASALPCEMVKYALRQTKEGIVVSFVVHPNDIPAALQTSHIGSRWMAALVQLGDDELPIKQKSAEAAQPRQIESKSTAGGKRDWRELQPAQQAGIRCGEPTFVAFLKEVYPQDWRESEEPAACVRLICGVHSRVELGTNPGARKIWTLLDEEYGAWKALENA